MGYNNDSQIYAIVILRQDEALFDVKEDLDSKLNWEYVLWSLLRFCIFFEKTVQTHT
jgi:hypothetical protein